MLGMVTALRKSLVDENIHKTSTPSPRKQLQVVQDEEELKAGEGQSEQVDSFHILWLSPINLFSYRIRLLRLPSHLMRPNSIAFLVTRPQVESIIW